MPFAIVAVPDLLFQSRFEAALRAHDVDVRVPASGAQAGAMLAHAPALVVVDLQAEAFDAPLLIRQAAATGAAVLAFGRHTDAAALKAARDAGADRAVARSQVADDLPALLEELLTHSSPGPALD